LIFFILVSGILFLKLAFKKYPKKIPEMGDLFSFILPNVSFKVVISEASLKFRVFHTDHYLRKQVCSAIVKHNDLSAIKLLQSEHTKLFELAVCNNKSAIVRYLLPKINPSFNNNYAIRVASKGGYTEIVQILLADSRVNLSTYGNYAIKIASEYGYTEMLRLLLAARVDPSASIDLAIAEASGIGHLGVVRLLLADKRTNPSAYDNRAIRLAAEEGHVEIVRLLMADSRVDPSADNNQAIRRAYLNGHMIVVKLLLTDNRTDPSGFYTFVVSQLKDF
jgi:hypothetical protein